MNYYPSHGNQPSGTIDPELRIEGDEFRLDLRGMLLSVWRRKGLLLLIVTLMLALGYWFAEGIEQRYSASARVLFEPERIQIIDYDNVLVRADPTSAGLQNQIEILRSAELMGRVAERLKLAELAEFNPSLMPPSELTSTLGSIGDGDPAEAVSGEGTEPATEQSGLTDAQRESAVLAGVITDDSEAAVAISTLWQYMSVVPVSDSRVIEITYSSLDPVLAAEIANTVAEEYVALQVEKKRNEILSASEALAGRVEELGQQLDEAEEAVRMARTESFGTVALTNRLEAINQALTQIRLDRTNLELSHRRAVGAVDDAALYAVVPIFRESKTLDDYRARERELEEELASLVTVVRGNDPQLRQINARLEEVRQIMKQEAHSIVEGLSLQLEIATENESNLADELRALEKEARSQSSVEQRLARLEREAQSSRVVYETFRNRLKEAREQANLQTPDARILTKALVPSSSDSAARFRIAFILGIGGGTVLALGIIFVLEALNDTFRSPEEVEKAIGLPVLASIPANRRARSPRKISDYVLKRPNSILAESVRNLRTSVLSSTTHANAVKTSSSLKSTGIHKGRRSEDRVVMITSSVPSEGKTSISLLLAQTTQHIERSSIVVDCDIRRQRPWDIITQKSTHGLVSVLEGQVDLETAIQVDPKTGVHVLSSGQTNKLSKNPADYLSSHQFADLVAQLRMSYDLVVLDTPPALVVTDARIVAKLANSVIYMIRWNKTPRNAVAYGLKQLRSVDAKIDGCVLSMVHESTASNMVRNNFFYKRKYRNYASS